MFSLTFCKIGNLQSVTSAFNPKKYLGVGPETSRNCT